MSKKPSDTVQVKVRMREDLRRKIERAAEKSGLTINAEILRRVDQSFGIADGLAPLERAIKDLRSDLEFRLERLTSRLEEAERYGTLRLMQEARRELAESQRQRQEKTSKANQP